MTTVFEKNEVEINKIGKTKSLYEEDEEEVYRPQRQPSTNPEYNSGNPELKQRKVNSPGSADAPSNFESELPKKGLSTAKLGWFIFFGVLASLIVLYLFLNSSSTDFAELKNVKWTREVFTERYQENTKEGWDLPLGAKVISSRQEIYQYNEIRHTKERCSTREEDIPSHKEYSHTNTKVEEDGTVRKKDIYRVVTKKGLKTYCWNDVEIERVPEYRQKYIYTIWEWTALPALKTQGEGPNSKPKFAKFRPNAQHRVAKKVSTYYAVLQTANGKVHEYKLTPEMFQDARNNFGKLCQVTWSYFELKNLKCGVSR